jgi:predicted deacylase
VTFNEYAARMREHAQVADVRVFAHVTEGEDRFPLMEVTSPGDRTLLITAGFHGDEVGGPLTLVEHLPDIVAYAHRRGVGLRVYPCLNPSGFEDGTRYTRSGQVPNNDFLRYEVEPGRWVDTLASEQTFLRWQVYRDGPRETRALLAALEEQPSPAAALDLHQDPWIGGTVAYAYVLGPCAPYQLMMTATDVHVPVARNREVDENVVTDENGLINWHDGSVTDYFYRCGVARVAALETSVSTPLPMAHEVHLVWIRGFIDLVAAQS